VDKKLLSPNALRLLGKAARITTLMDMPRVARFCEGQYDPGLPQQAADELVEHGYFDRVFDGFGRPLYLRTDKPYTEQMRSRLMRLAQEHVAVIRDTLKHYRAPQHLPGVLQDWLGYPTAQRPEAIGRIYRLEDDEE
jgi:hypothetical protein